jgi:hypothetical protein
MIFLSTKAYRELVERGAVQESFAREIVELRRERDKLLDTVLALKMAGAELPPGHGEPGFDKYTFDEIEEEAMGDDLPPSPRPPDEMDPDDILDIARALGYKH